MTMKTKKTLHRFTAVTAVLLAFCLVFMMPVGAVDIQPTEFVDKTYTIDVSDYSENTEFVLKGTSYGNIVIDGADADNSIDITITSDDDATLHGGIIISHTGVDYIPYSVTIKNMDFFLNHSMKQKIEGSWAPLQYDVIAVVVKKSGHGPVIKLTLEDNTFTFDDDVYTNKATARAMVLNVYNGGLIHGSKISGNTAHGVTGPAFVFAGVSQRHYGGYTDNPETTIISDNEIWIKPIQAFYTIDEVSESSGFKIFSNREPGDSEVVPYEIRGNTVHVETTSTDTWTIPVLRVEYNDEVDDSNKPFRDTAIVMENNKITTGHSIYAFVPKLPATDFDFSHFKSFTVKSEVTVDGDIVGGTLSVNPVSYVNGTKVTITATPQAGYIFDETTLQVISNSGANINVAGMTFDMPYEPVTVTGSFEAIPYTVTVNGGSATQGMATVGTTITLTANDPESGFVFKEWKVISGDVTITDNKFTMPAGDVSITAVFGEKKEEPVTPPTEDTPEPVEPSFEDAVATETTEEGVKVTINAAESSVSTSTDGKTYFIEDEESGVTLTLFFTEAPSSEDSEDSISGVVEHVSANYNYDAGTNSDSDITDIDVHLSIGLDSPDTPLPKINPEFKEELSQKITEKHSDHTPLAMITAETNVDAINNNLTKKTDRVPLVITFMIDASSLADIDLTQHKFVGYHISGDSVDIIDAHWSEDDDKIIIILNGKHFSSYAVGIAPASSESDEGDDTPSVTPSQRPTSGGATDTGSGNYNEYPRQADGKAGEISFGSSKDVKAVDLPEGVTGEVKLIAKSTHPAPEGKETHKVFEINIPNYPTGKAATIKFEMTLADIEAKGLTAADVCLYHFNKETGLWEKLPTTFKVVDGKVYFEAVTTGFSPFAIVFEKGAATPAAGADEPVTPPTETPDVPETPGTLPPVDTPETPEQPTESPAPILAVLAGLGAAVVLRRK